LRIVLAKLLLLSKTTLLMKHFFLIFALALLFTLNGCDDGDIIITSFDFDEIAIEQCGDVGQFVFFKINSSNFESLSLQLTTQDSILNSVITKNYPLNTTSNVINYRTFNESITSAYFCSAIPPITPRVNANFVSTQGTASIVTTAVFLETGSGIPTDSIIAYSTLITLQNIRLESETETITQETLVFGTIRTPAN